MINPEIHQKLRQQYNPDGSMLRTIQMSILDSLLELDRICRKEGIQYWLDAGTLLGAARHGGFIPWDDDLDVCVMKKDRKKLKEAMEKELKPSFEFEDINFKKYTATTCARLRNNRVSVLRNVPNPQNPKETIVKRNNVWLDIFYLVNGRPEISKKIDLFYGPCFRRVFKTVEDGKFKRFVSLCLFPVSLLLILLARIWGFLFQHKLLIYDYGCGFYAQRVKDDIFPLSEIEFEGHIFPAPSNYDKYLRRIYGDWNVIPDIKTSHNIIDIEENK
jgi:lipopolysaccharide cholinephosphotransferase